MKNKTSDKKVTKKVTKKASEATKEKKVEKKKVEKVITEPKKVEKVNVIVKESKNHDDSKFKLWFVKNKTKVFASFGITLGLVLLIVLAACIPTGSDDSMVSYIIDTTPTEYFEYLKGDEAKVILLASPTCSWCQKYRPIIKKLATDYKVNVYYVDTSSLSEIDYTNIHDSSTSLKTQYNGSMPVIPTPTTLVVKGGKEIDSISGYVEYDTLKSMFQKNGIIK